MVWQKKLEAEIKRRRDAEKAARSYDSLFTNEFDVEEGSQRKTARELEDDFMWLSPHTSDAEATVVNLQITVRYLFHGIRKKILVHRAPGFYMRQFQRYVVFELSLDARRCIHRHWPLTRIHTTRVHLVCHYYIISCKRKLLHGRWQ